MQVLTGRITANAKVNMLKDERKVVNFSIAINDSYKAKGSETLTKVVTYVNCSYWRNEKIAEYLTKGTIVELCGRISVSAYTALNGDVRANLNFHTTEIKLLSGSHAKENAETKEGTEKTAAAAQPVSDDLPF